MTNNPQWFCLEGNILIHLRLKVAEPYSNYACRLEIAALSVVAQFGQGQTGPD